MREIYGGWELKLLYILLTFSSFLMHTSFQMEPYRFMAVSIVHIRNLLVLFTSLHLFPKAPVGSWKWWFFETVFCQCSYWHFFIHPHGVREEKKSWRVELTFIKVIPLSPWVMHFTKGTVGATRNVWNVLNIEDHWIICLSFSEIFFFITPDTGGAQYAHPKSDMKD